MSNRPECSYPTCDDPVDVAVQFDDGATANYCEPHADRAIEQYAGVDDHTKIPESAWDE